MRTRSADGSSFTSTALAAATLTACLAATTPSQAALVTGSAAPLLAATAIAGTSAYIGVPDLLDAASADDTHLAAYGIPPRPDPIRAPEAYLSWTQAVIGVQRLAPSLQAVALYHGPIRRAANGPNATSTNWSGYVVASQAFNFGAQSLTGVHGVWTVPVAQPAYGACAATPNGAPVFSSTWVGLDGNGSADVLQAGTESDAACAQGQVASYATAWYEWYPFNEVRITNLPVAAGSAMYVYVWASSATQGHAYVANITTRQAVSVAFAAPPGTSLVGNSAEWIVERPSVSGTLADLTNYVQELFADARAHDATHHDYYPGNALVPGAQPALAVRMTDAANAVISTPMLLGRNAIWFMDGGSAEGTPTAG